MDFGLTQHVERLRYRWPRVAARESCGDRSSKQSLNGQVGVLPEKMDESQGCHQPDEKCAGLRSSAFFLPTKIQQKWPNFWHNFLRSCWFEIHTCSLRPWGLRPTTCWSVLKQSAHRTLASCFFGHETVSECFMILMRFQNNVYTLS